MGKPNPFFRFTPAQINGGFEPGLTIQSGLTDDLFSQFTNGDYVGDPYGSAIESINQIIDLFNLPANGGFFRLIYPSPWPVISGSQTLTFYIQSDQLHAVDSLQRITIILSLVNGVVSGSTFSFVGPTTKSSDYANPLIPAEVEIKRALEVYYQNGAAIFPLTYSFDATTGIATSFLAEASDWQLDLTTGVVDRYPAIANPFGPVTYYPFPVLSAQETYILTLFDRVINYTVLNPSATASDVETYANSIVGSLNVTIVTATSGILERISIQFSESRDFLLIGRFDVTWSFQRFFNPTSSTNDFFTDYNISEDLPYAPLSGQLFPDDWYSLEQIQFDNGCEPDDSDTFQMPIKTGDIYQFNVIPSQANLFGLTTAKVGLFDSDLNFVQEIGTAQKPYTLRYTFELPFEFEPGCIVSRVGLFEDEVLFENIIPGYTQNFGTSTLTVLEFIEIFIANLNIGTAYYEPVTNGYNLVWSIENTSFAFIPLASLGFQFTFGPITTWANCYEGINCTDLPTQLQATVTIPFAPDGCYSFGLYNYDGTIAEIYSFSNALILDNSECFSTIWQFGTSQESIVEGFEYYSGWIQKVRMPINGGGEKPKIEESIYRNSDGTYQRPSNYSDNTLDLHSDYLDIETRNAVFAATRHPILIFENQNIFVSGDLEVATVQDYSRQTSFRKLAQVRFSALIQGFQPENNVCIGC